MARFFHFGEFVFVQIVFPLGRLEHQAVGYQQLQSLGSQIARADAEKILPLILQPMAREALRAPSFSSSAMILKQTRLRPRPVTYMATTTKTTNAAAKASICR